MSNPQDRPEHGSARTPPAQPRKATSLKAPARKVAAKKAPAKKTPAKKAPAEKAPAEATPDTGAADAAATAKSSVQQAASPATRPARESTSKRLTLTIGLAAASLLAGLLRRLRRS